MGVTARLGRRWVGGPTRHSHSRRDALPRSPQAALSSHWGYPACPRGGPGNAPGLAVPTKLTFPPLLYLLVESRAFSAGVDPDDTYNETPYEKGFCFVSYLAHLVGDQDQFDRFLRVHQLGGAAAGGGGAGGGGVTGLEGRGQGWAGRLRMALPLWDP